MYVNEEENTAFWDVVSKGKPITSFEVGLFSSRELGRLLGKPLFGKRNEQYDPNVPVFDCLAKIHPEFEFDHIVKSQNELQSLEGEVLTLVASRVTGEGWFGHYCFRSPGKSSTWLPRAPDEESAGDVHAAVVGIMIRDLQQFVDNLPAQAVEPQLLQTVRDFFWKYRSVSGDPVSMEVTTVHTLVIDYAGPRLEYSCEFWQYIRNSKHFDHIQKYASLLNTPETSSFTTELILEKTQDGIPADVDYPGSSPKLTLRGFIFEGVPPKRESSNGKGHTEAVNNEYERNQVIAGLKKTGDKLFSELVSVGCVEEESSPRLNEPSHISQDILRDISGIYKRELLNAIEKWKKHPEEDEQTFGLTPQNTFDGVTRRYCNIALFQAWEYFIENFRQTLEPSSIKSVVPVLSFMDDDIPVVTFYLLK